MGRESTERIGVGGDLSAQDERAHSRGVPDGRGCRYADNFGISFQIRDDMLDVVGDEETFGKPIGSDREEGKTTFVDILGLNGCLRVIEAHSESAVEALFGLESTDFLTHLVRIFEKREQ